MEKEELFARTTATKRQVKLYPGIHMCRYLCLLCTIHLETYECPECPKGEHMIESTAFSRLTEKMPLELLSHVWTVLVHSCCLLYTTIQVGTVGSSKYFQTL